MRTIFTFALVVIANCFVVAVDAQEIIKNNSPDGKFALQLTHGEEGWNTAIIDVKTKKKIIDLENVAVSGDDAKDATLLWSNDSQRVAYFNESRAEIAARIYFRNGDTFEEVPLPEIPRCDEIKDEDPKYLSTVSYRLTPKHWIDTQTLFVEVYGEWKTLKGEYIGCGQNVLLAFDRQQKASIAKIERPTESVGRKIQSPQGNFFVEELDVAMKDDEGNPDVDHDVWVVSAKDPTQRERLPDFYEKSGTTILHRISISPDENWIVVAQHYGSHMNSTYLLRRSEGVKFARVFDDTLDREAWKFFCKIEAVPFAKIDANEEQVTPLASASVYDWSDDSGRVLLALSGGLTGKEDDVYYAAEHKQPGVDLWFFYYNTRTQKFEVTDRLRKANKNARKRWHDISEKETGFVPPSAEAIGHEGVDAPLSERLKKYDTALAAMSKRRESQLEWAERAEFQEQERKWRDDLESKAAKLKDAQVRLGFRTRSTWFRLNAVREKWLPVFEESKTDETKRSQP